MPKAKVSWLLCIGRLVSKTDNVMHFACLVEQASVTRFCDLYVYYRLGCDLFVYGAYIKTSHSLSIVREIQRILIKWNDLEITNIFPCEVLGHCEFNVKTFDTTQRIFKWRRAFFVDLLDWRKGKAELLKLSVSEMYFPIEILARIDRYFQWQMFFAVWISCPRGFRWFPTWIYYRVFACETKLTWRAFNTSCFVNEF